MDDFAIRTEVSLRQAVDVLNRILREDRAAVVDLLNYRVRCNIDLADDPTVQVGAYTDEGCHLDPDKRTEGSLYRVGVLGVINGLFGTDEQGGPIGAVYDSERGQLVRFEVAKRLDGL